MRAILALALVAAACAPAAKSPPKVDGVTVLTNMTEMPPPEGAVARPPESSVCDASKVQDVVGKARSDALAEDARVRSGSKVVRYLTPDMMVTMEFRADRLNLHVGVDGKIGSARCG